MMHELIWILFSCWLGFITGFFYFGGLWWTVKNLPRLKKPTLVAAGSFWLRAGLSVSVFIFLARGGHWERLAASLLAFLAIRMLFIRHLSSGQNKENNLLEG
jgi:F1F0 ATPase subunit 2